MFKKVKNRKKTLSFLIVFKTCNCHTIFSVTAAAEYMPISKFYKHSENTFL